MILSPLTFNGVFKKIHKSYSGFTIVELLVVIVVIGILAAISIVSYVGITQKAATATLKSDLNNSVTKLEIDKALNGSYPSSIDAANDGKGLPKSSDTDYQYTLSGNDYYLSAVSLKANSTAYFASSVSGGSIESGVWSGHIMPGPGVWRNLAISVGDSAHICATDFYGKAYCWGNGNDGELGNNSTTNSSVPVAVDVSGSLSGKTIKSIAIGQYHTCAIASDNKVYCWGKNDFGQIGNNSTVNSLTPVAVNTDGVLNNKTIKSVSASGTSSCVVASDDKAYCWGGGGNGQLGNGTYNSSLVPVAVTVSGLLSGKTIKSIVTGGSSTSGSATCAIASDDHVYCWGNGGQGQLGNNSTSTSLTPVAVDTTGVFSDKTIKLLSAGGSYNCAIASDDQAYCWGFNAWGQLGNNSTTSSLVPIAVNTEGALTNKTIMTISAGFSSVCAIASDAQAYCWGDNYRGHLGDNSTVQRLVPTAVYTSGVLSGKTIKQIVNATSSCVIASDSKAYCWGFNYYGGLGSNSGISYSAVPVATYITN